MATPNKNENNDVTSEISTGDDNLNRTKVEWSPENEKILVEWCDVAQCYKWLNMRAHKNFSNLHAWFTIPAIILSTISGTASFAQSSFPESTQLYVPMAVGSLNIFIGILTTIQQYLKISELNESHRVSSIAWDKFARNIRIELAKKPEERLDAGAFIKHCRDEFDRLMETSPSISDKIVADFKTNFKGKDDAARKRFEQLRKPDICDTIVSVNETRHKWYLALENIEEEISEELVKEKEAIIAEQRRLLSEKEEEIKNTLKENKDELTKQSLLEKDKIKRHMAKKIESSKLQEQVDEMYKISKDKIDKHIEAFDDMFDRKPLHEEIIENLQEEISEEHISKFLETYVVDDIPGDENV
jgi:hypothetical protein|uniref:SMODS and SLOG-associating 2TM effector domain-containing protein n=1 Tax=viral metagenome TaxID=1070528 RepID=A0A6C0IQP5_9ZZZZ